MAHTLPGTDVPLPDLGLGTWAWGDRSTWGMNGYDQSYDFATIEADPTPVPAPTTYPEVRFKYFVGSKDVP